MFDVRGITWSVNLGKITCCPLELPSLSNVGCSWHSWPASGVDMVSIWCDGCLHFWSTYLMFFRFEGACQCVSDPCHWHIFSHIKGSLTNIKGSLRNIKGSLRNIKGSLSISKGHLPQQPISNQTVSVACLRGHLLGWTTWRLSDRVFSLTLGIED